MRGPGSAFTRSPAWIGEWVFAHRGLHRPDGALENSLPAFRAAVENGFGIECDVQASADGAAMVFHDWTLDRLTERNGNVRDLGAAELGRIALDRNSGTIPHLADLLAMVRGRVPILIELKSKRGVDWRPLARATVLALSGYSGAVATMSFDPRIVRWMRKHAGQSAAGLVIGRREFRESGGRGGFGAYRALALRWVDPDFLACDLQDLPDPFIADQRTRGMAVLGWTARTAALRSRAKRCCDAPIAEGAGIA